MKCKDLHQKYRAYKKAEELCMYECLLNIFCLRKTPIIILEMRTVMLCDDYLWDRGSGYRC